MGIPPWYPYIYPPPECPEGSLSACRTPEAGNGERFSNFAIDGSITNAVAAPGGAAFLSCADDVISTVPVGSEGACGAGTPGYDAYAGTSMATPHVAGVAALLHAQGRSNLAVVDVLKATARNPVTGLRGVWDPVYGHGIVDAAAAVVG